MAKPKRRVTYTKDMRAAAKKQGTGLVTVQVECLDGTVTEEQFLAGPLQCKFAQWALAWLACPDVHRLPDLEGRFRAAMDETP